jgi:hypothetical protein
MLIDLSLNPLSSMASGRVAQIEQERGQPCPRVANPLEDLPNLCKMDRADSAVRAPGLWTTRPSAKLEALRGFTPTTFQFTMHL